MATTPLFKTEQVATFVPCYCRSVTLGPDRTSLLKLARSSPMRISPRWASIWLPLVGFITLIALVPFWLIRLTAWLVHP